MNKHKLHEAVEARKIEIQKSDIMAADLQTLISALPNGQRKQLMKDKTCAGILEKYGITEE